MKRPSFLLFALVASSMACAPVDDDSVVSAESRQTATPERDAAASTLPSCGETASVSLTLAAPVGRYGEHDPGPLAPVGDHTFVFLGSSMWMDVHRGSAITKARPAPIEHAQTPRAFGSLAVKTAVLWDEGKLVKGASFDGTTFGEPVAVPCTSTELLGAECDARAASDGHLWVRVRTNLYEQVGDALELRGGAPRAIRHWDVDGAGNVLILGSWSGEELISYWRLAPNTGGWAKLGALTNADVASIDPEIEGGFGLDSAVATIALDGSVHVFSNARAGRFNKNRTQFYLRSRNGKAWETERLPAADILYDGQITLRHVALWAEDFDHVRTVMASSKAPVRQGSEYVFPDRTFNLLTRCRDAAGQASFARSASLGAPDWNDEYPTFAAFSDTGVLTTFTHDGVTQIH